MPLFSRLSELSIAPVALSLIAVFVLAGIARLVLKEGSNVIASTASCVQLMLVGLTAIAIYAAFPALGQTLPQLPFLNLQAYGCSLLSPAQLESHTLFPALLRLFLLALLINLWEELLPKSKKIAPWLLLRLLSAVGSLCCFFLLCEVLQRYCPQMLDQWSMSIVLSILGGICLLGICKGLLTVVAAVVHPLLGLLFAFFFSHVIGRQLTRAVITGVLFLGIAWYLGESGISGCSYDLQLLPVCLLTLAIRYALERLL